MVIESLIVIAAGKGREIDIKPYKLSWVPNPIESLLERIRNRYHMHSKRNS